MAKRATVGAETEHPASRHVIAANLQPALATPVPTATPGDVRTTAAVAAVLATATVPARPLLAEAEHWGGCAQLFPKGEPGRCGHTATDSPAASDFVFAVPIRASREPMSSPQGAPSASEAPAPPAAEPPLGAAPEAAGSTSPAALDDREAPWLISPALIPSKLLPSGIVNMSPALVPSNAISYAVERLPALESQLSSEQHFFPLEAAAQPASADSVSGAAALPEGGIMMLSDLQEKHASRATLSSAWRDYGVQLLVSAQSEGLGPAHELHPEEAALLRRLGADIQTEPRVDLQHENVVPAPGSPSAAEPLGADNRAELSKLSESRGVISPIAVSCGDETQLARLLGADIGECGLPEPMRLEGDAEDPTEELECLANLAQVEVSTWGDCPTGNADGEVRLPKRQRQACSLMGKEEGAAASADVTRSQGPDVKDEPACASISPPQRVRSVLLSDSEIRTARAPTVAATPGSILAAATASALSMKSKTDSCAAGEAPGNADPDEAQHGDGASEHEPEDEAVRVAVRAEMVSGGLTQHAVAQQVGVSQPVLCTWLSGKHHKHSGKNARHVIKGKLCSWLSSRSVELASCLPAADSILSSSDATPSLEPTPEPADASGSDTISPLLLPAHPPQQPPLSSRSRASSGARPRPADGQSIRRHEGGARAAKGRGARASQDALAASADELDCPSRAVGGEKLVRHRGKGDGSSGEEPCEGDRFQSGGVGHAGRVRLTPQHLYVAYIWYLNQREHDGFAAGEEEHFCFKCKDGGDVMLCDFNNGKCYKSYHARCCNLKAVPEGNWECPRHRCIKCGAGKSKTDAQGRPRRPRSTSEEACTLWPCRTCPETYCARCLPESVLHVGSEVICESCQTLLNSDLSLLQRDLVNWDPDQFAVAAGHPDWKLPAGPGSAS